MRKNMLTCPPETYPLSQTMAPVFLQIEGHLPQLPCLLCWTMSVTDESLAVVASEV